MFVVLCIDSQFFLFFYKFVWRESQVFVLQEGFADLIVDCCVAHATCSLFITTTKGEGAFFFIFFIAVHKKDGETREGGQRCLYSRRRG